jgi:hypothetical protein
VRLDPVDVSPEAQVVYRMSAESHVIVSAPKEVSFTAAQKVTGGLIELRGSVRLDVGRMRYLLSDLSLRPIRPVRPLTSEVYRSVRLGEVLFEVGLQSSFFNVLDESGDVLHGVSHEDLSDVEAVQLDYIVANLAGEGPAEMIARLRGIKVDSATKLLQRMRAKGQLSPIVSSPAEPEPLDEAGEN